MTDTNYYINKFKTAAKPQKYEVNDSLAKARDEILQLLSLSFPDYEPQVSIIKYENDDIKHEFSISTSFDIENDSINVRFNIRLMVPLLSHADISAAVNEEDFWEFVNTIYTYENFANFNFINIQNAGPTQHTSGKGFIYGLTLNGTISLVENLCKEV